VNRRRRIVSRIGLSGLTSDGRRKAVRSICISLSGMHRSAIYFDYRTPPHRFTSSGIRQFSHREIGDEHFARMRFFT
jgi:hypothetical protein